MLRRDPLIHGNLCLFNFQMNFGSNQPSVFGGEDVCNCSFSSDIGKKSNNEA